jgi:hypothetical protein
MSDAPGGVEDLSGHWHGFYNMPFAAPPTPFEVELRDTDGLLSGEISEEGDTPDCFGLTLHSVIDGHRAGDRVSFTKRYDYLPRAHYALLYDGVLAPGGDEIEGRWSVPGAWSGTFLMVRARGEAVSEAAKVEEKVPLRR